MNTQCLLIRFPDLSALSSSPQLKSNTSQKLSKSTPTPQKSSFQHSSPLSPPLKSPSASQNRMFMIPKKGAARSRSSSVPKPNSTVPPPSPPSASSRKFFLRSSTMREGIRGLTQRRCFGMIGRMMSSRRVPGARFLWAGRRII